MLGRPLWNWQRDFSAIALSRENGRFKFPIVTVCVPRQSGKTSLVGLLALHRCLVTADAQVWYTAQSRMDAVLRWRELVRLLRRSRLVELPSGTRNLDDASDWDYRVRSGVGTELVEFRNGSQLQVFSPSEDSLHGSVTDLIILDEARFFDEVRGRGLMAAALPTQATRDGQVWIVSTGGGPDSTFLASELEAGRAGIGDPTARRAHCEYGIGSDVPDGELLSAVWSAHPAAGCDGGPKFDALQVASESMPAWQFAHEYGNRWRSEADARLIPESSWSRGRMADLPAGRAVFAADVAIDRSSAAVVACVGNTISVVDYRPGVVWLADRLCELADRYEPAMIAIDAAGPAGSVAEELRPRLPVLHVTSTRELAGACGLFHDAALADPPLVGHVESADLDIAVSVATWRTVGQSKIWSRVESGPLMIASSLALWASGRIAAETPPEPPAIW
jgi:hypothetical protein